MNTKGYVHNLSPKKSSKAGTKYFSFDLETEPKCYRRSVCFDSKLYEPIKHYQSSGTPVKFRNIQRKKSLQNPDEEDFILNKRSCVEEANNTEVMFERNQRVENEQLPYATVLEIDQLHQGDSVCINGKLTVDAEKEESISKNGHNYRLLRGVITDFTGTIRIRLWDDHCNLKNGQSYTFTNLKVREYDDNKCLTTSPSTTVSSIDEEFPDPSDKDVNDVITVAVTAFKMVNNFSTWFTCLNCSKHLTDVATLKTAQCHSCKAVMLLDACPKMASIKVCYYGEIGCDKIVIYKLFH